ncbi:polysaccharide deacetylase family protein [Actinoplanes bogorensis]|uniref:Polysaccharide deacetylase family protein n=1 Tax=Paractinoplanes bogorensis TaxID=1610840 RepID=A0ABS5YX28_9ACTN|nr:polysaccharide deacetylase family protein [Actinoplanes bogorensis]MBU2667997.1 polysaccharide deacetylase family protein [Actinoplanes bogorensis]
MKAAAALAGLAAAHAAPALAAVGPLRRLVLPGLAGRGDPGHVALTFDDGPHPEATPRLLRLLDSGGVRATFFLLGRMAAEHPKVARAIATAGHEIAVHGYDHRLLLKRRPTETFDDLAHACETIAAVTGRTPRWWRPPYGVASTAALFSARRLGLTPVLWTCWGRDWTAGATPDSVFRAVRRGLRGGGTILLHDSDHAAASRAWEATLGALPAILTHCRVRGFEVGPLGAHGLGPGPLQPALSRSRPA